MSTTPINLLRGWPHPSLLSGALLRTASAAVLSDPALSTPALSYGPDEGHEPLRRHLSAWLTEFHQPSAPVTLDRICISGGASQNLACVLQAFTDPATTRAAFMVSPTYFLAARIFADAGFSAERGNVRRVPEDAEGLDVEALRAALEASDREADARPAPAPAPLKPAQAWNKRYRHVIYCVPTHANPSGKTMSLRRREALVRLARSFDALVVCDDVYDMLGWRPPTTASAAPAPLAQGHVPRVVDVDRALDGGPPDAFGHVVSQGSFSKLLGPGTRTGWAEAAPALAYGLSQVGSSRSGGAASQLVAAFVAEGLRTGAVQHHVADVVRPGLARRWRRLDGAVRQLLFPLGVRLFHHGGDGVSVAAEEGLGGYFVTVQLPAGVSAVALAELCRERTRLILAPGPLFAVEPESDEERRDLGGMVRLCFAWEEEERLEQGVRELADGLRAMMEAGDGGTAGHTRDAGRQELDLANWR